MANKKHLAILKLGVDAWNRWPEQTRNASIIPNLTDADLEDAELDRIDFRWTELQRANLRGSQLVQQISLMPISVLQTFQTPLSETLT